ncbi:MAG TPA: chorismate synthase [Anaerolineae bacterium]|nr:chorismate synthase [Anaerolineae bacterium]
MRFLTAGESHGPCLTAILEGMPAGLPLRPEDVNQDMRRRQKAYGAGGRMKIERDVVTFTGGVMAAHTTGGPIAIRIENRDWKNWAQREIPPLTVPRPGHADLTAAVKYGYRELRLALERASARETAARVAVGAVCKRFLSQFGIRVQAYVTEIGGVVAHIPEDMPYETRFELAETNDVRCPDAEAVSQMHERIRECMEAKDTLGGVFEVVALGVPPGLGSHVQYDRRLSGRLMGAVGSIHAIKGVEIGHGFANAHKRGTEVHDEIFLDGRKLVRRTNRAGGLEGGISNGMPIVVRAAMKPIATTLTPLHSVDLATGQPAATCYERSDFCAVPRAAVVGEAMVAFVLADALLEKLGGDSLDEMRPRFAALRRLMLDDLPMDNGSWRFGYDTPPE